MDRQFGITPGAQSQAGSELSRPGERGVIPFSQRPAGSGARASWFAEPASKGGSDRGGAGSPRLAPRTLRVLWGQRRPQVAGPRRRSGSGSGRVSGTSLRSPSVREPRGLGLRLRLSGVSSASEYSLQYSLDRMQVGARAHLRARILDARAEVTSPAPAPGEGTTEPGPSPPALPIPLSADTHSSDVSLGAANRPPRHLPGFWVLLLQRHKICSSPV